MVAKADSHVPIIDIGVVAPNGFLGSPCGSMLSGKFPQMA